MDEFFSWSKQAHQKKRLELNLPLFVFFQDQLLKFPFLLGR